MPVDLRCCFHCYCVFFVYPGKLSVIFSSPGPTRSTFRPVHDQFESIASISSYIYFHYLRLSLCFSRYIIISYECLGQRSFAEIPSSTGHNAHTSCIPVNPRSTQIWRRLEIFRGAKQASEGRGIEAKFQASLGGGGEGGKEGYSSLLDSFMSPSPCSARLCRCPKLY